LGLPQGFAQGMQLAIDVRFGNVVQVDQVKRSDPRAGERFRTPGPYPAYAGHRYSRHMQARKTIRAVQALKAAKTALGVGRGVGIGHVGLENLRKKVAGAGLCSLRPGGKFTRAMRTAKKRHLSNKHAASGADCLKIAY